MKKRRPFIYLHMSFRLVLTLAVTVSIGALTVYLQIRSGSLAPDITSEEVRVAAVIAAGTKSVTPVETPSEPPATPVPAASPVSSEEAEETEGSGSSAVYLSQYATLFPGDDNAFVGDLRNRLQALGYLEADEPSSVYNESVQAAVSLFQRTSGLEVNGIADGPMQALLYSDSACVYRIVPGDSGNDVYAVQMRLKELGYYTARTSGYYGPQTKEAVSLFEYRNGLEQDGILSYEDRKQLFSYDAGMNYSPLSEDPALSSDVSPSDSVITFAHNADGLGYAVSNQLDKPYVWGKDGPDAFDCSGLLSYCLRLCGISVSKTDPEGYSRVEAWPVIEKASFLKKGDLVFFKSDGSDAVVHAGISLGSTYFIHASSSSGKVTMSSLSEPYWERNFLFGRRVFNG